MPKDLEGRISARIAREESLKAQQERERVLKGITRQQEIEQIDRKKKDLLTGSIGQKVFDVIRSTEFTNLMRVIWKLRSVKNQYRVQKGWPSYKWVDKETSIPTFNVETSPEVVQAGSGFEIVVKATCKLSSYPEEKGRRISTNATPDFFTITVFCDASKQEEISFGIYTPGYDYEGSHSDGRWKKFVTFKELEQYVEDRLSQRISLYEF